MHIKQRQIIIAFFHLQISKYISNIYNIFICIYKYIFIKRAQKSSICSVAKAEAKQKKEINARCRQACKTIMQPYKRKTNENENENNNINSGNNNTNIEQANRQADRIKQGLHRLDAHKQKIESQLDRQIDRQNWAYVRSVNEYRGLLVFKPAKGLQ